MEPDVVIADIGSQALDIVLHGPEPAHKNGIVKTNIDSHIHSHPPIHTPKTKSKTVNSLNVTRSLSSPIPVQNGGGRRPGSLADAPHDCSMSEAFTPTTVLTENICRCLPHKLQHHVEPDDVVIADIGDHTRDVLLHGPEFAHKNGTVKTNLHSHIRSHPLMHTPKTES